MRGFDKQEAWELKPRKLSIDETEAPESVIRELFEYANLPQLRWQLSEAAKSMVAGDFHRLRSRDRSSLICFYEQIERLIEVAHILHEREKSKNSA